MKHVIDIRNERRTLPAGGGPAFRIGAGVAVLGAVLTGIGMATGADMHRLAWSYLVNYMWVLTIALGALVFVMIQHVTHAGWSVVVRRLAEAIAANMPILAIFAIPIVLGSHSLYHWTHADVVANDPVLKGKSGYLNMTFFTIRLVIYFAVWSLFSWWLHRKSVEQDKSGDPALTLSLEKWSPLGIVLFAITCTFAAFDLLMSLDPHWFSTIFGVYVFSGAMLSFLATLGIVTRLTQRAGLLENAITIEHYHDIGKFTFAFVVFWAYIAFSQYMLIWYANLPEETIWYFRRQTGGWLPVSLLLLFGHFVAPFLGLISRIPKRRPGMLVVAGVWLLFMHWIDLYWLVMPEMNHEAKGVVPFNIADLGLLLFLGGLFVALTARRLSRHSLIPEQDPRLAESLTFENV